MFVRSKMLLDWWLFFPQWLTKIYFSSVWEWQSLCNIKDMKKKKIFNDLEIFSFYSLHNINTEEASHTSFINYFFV